MRSLQQHAQVYFNVAWVGAQGFLRRRLAEAAGDELIDELFAQIVGQSFEPAADGGFMNGQRLRDLQKCLAVEKVGREQKAVFRSETPQSAGHCCCELRQVGGDWSGRRCGAIEIVERRFPVGAAMMVSPSLHKCGAEPGQERTAARVGGQR